MKLGGVSLFDFNEFDPMIYAEKCPASAGSWHAFVPYRSKWGGAVWIEIDRQKVAAQLITASDAVEKWKAEEARGHNLMPYIEAIHIGPLSCSAFRRAFLVRESETILQPIFC
jgi:regulation of enolase protein 1 (concanavalin A-like superfamily)